MVRRILLLSGAAVVLALLFAGIGHAQDRGMGSGTSKPGKATASAPVNLNTATAADLRTLPNVGPATAARIIEYRQKNGGFKKIEDLMNVKGIGEKSFLKLKPMIVATPGPAAAAKAGDR
jgi:competence protein ComEA